MSEKQTPEITSEVNKVTIYNDRARVIRTGKGTLSAGKHAVILPRLPQQIVEGSFRAKAFSQVGITIMDVKTKTRNFSQVQNENVKFLQEKAEKVREEMRKLDAQEAILQKKRDFLQSIQINSTENISKELDYQRPNIEDWNNILDFLGGNYQKLDEAQADIDRKKKELKGEIEKFTRDLAVLSGAMSKSELVGIVELELAAEGEVAFEIEYQIRSASWKPFYDARVDTETKKVHLQYYGLVTQKTGEDWTGVQIRLSTARPHIAGNAPTLSPWYLRKYVPPTPKPGDMRSSGIRKKSKGRAMEKEIGGADYDEIEEEAFAVMQEAPAPEAVVQQTEVESGSGASVIFLVPGDSDVPGDGGESRLLIMENEYGGEFRYLSVPKLNELAFLEAEVENDTDFPLLPGKMNVFKDGDFIGNARLKELKTPGETFRLELGVDESIRIKHKLVKAKGKEKGLFSKSKSTDFDFLITIENLRDTEEKIIVRDQLPVSQHEDIKVSLESVQPAENPEKDEEKLPNGTVEWALKLPPKQETKCRLHFNVSHPADERVTGMEGW